MRYTELLAALASITLYALVATGIALFCTAATLLILSLFAGP